MPSVSDDDAKVGDLTRQVMNAGCRVLQIYKFGDTERGHVAALLAYLNPPKNAHILDAGCGVGEVARLMAEERPDLNFTLLNISPAHLNMCPPELPKVRGRLEDLSAFDDGHFDAVMICYALGHADLEQTIGEASRVLRQHGILFIYDMTAQDVNRLRESLSYQLHTPDTVAACAAKHGFPADLAVRVLPSNASMRDFSRLETNAELFELLGAVQPILYRFVKC